MVIPIGEEYTATVEGLCRKEVLCEKCNTRFYYEIGRNTRGQASAYFFIGMSDAKKRAQRRATRNLNEKLKNDVELVPCPTCQWINESVVAQYRTRFAQRLRANVIGLLFLGVFAGGVTGLLGSRYDGFSPATIVFPILIGLALCSVLALWLYLHQYAKLKQIDPNRSYPNPPSIPDGTPGALVFDANSNSLVPAGKYQPNSEASKGVIYRSDQVDLLVLPTHCCACMDLPDRAYRSFIHFEMEAGPKIPICKKCQSTAHRKWLVAFGKNALISLAFGTLLVFIPWPSPFIGWVGFALTALIWTLIVGLVRASSASVPYRISGVGDAASGTRRFRAVNPQYNAIVAELLRASDGQDAISPK